MQIRGGLDSGVDTCCLPRKLAVNGADDDTCMIWPLAMESDEVFSFHFRRDRQLACIIFMRRVATGGPQIGLLVSNRSRFVCFVDLDDLFVATNTGVFAAEWAIHGDYPIFGAHGELVGEHSSARKMRKVKTLFIRESDEIMQRNGLCRARFKLELIGIIRRRCSKWMVQ